MCLGFWLFDLLQNIKPAQLEFEGKPNLTILEEIFSLRRFISQKRSH